MHTVEDLVRSVLPWGSNGALWDEESTDNPLSNDFLKISKETSLSGGWLDIPVWPPDTFAVVAMLVKWTGAYSFVKPGLPYNTPSNNDFKWEKTSDPFGLFGPNGDYRNQNSLTGQLWRYGLLEFDFTKLEEDSIFSSFQADIKSVLKADIHLNAEERQSIEDASSQLKNLVFSYERLQKIWKRIVTIHKDLPIIQPIGPWEELQVDPDRIKFFKDILNLLVISDEACTGIREQYRTNLSPWLTNYRAEQLKQNMIEYDELVGVLGVVEGITERMPEYGLANWSREDIAPVLPKSRTASLGCSLRSLCRNLALGPPITEVKTNWNNTPGSEGSDLFNVLAIPFPWQFEHSVFKPSYPDSSLCDDSISKRWRWFEVEQSWLPNSGDIDNIDKIVQEFMELIEEAEKKGGDVNCVVLPESVLTYEIFKALAEKLKDKDSLELLIAGTSDAPKTVLMGLNALLTDKPSESKHGNFVCTALYLRSGDSVEYSVSAQHKHHRWKLDSQQISDYGAAGKLDPNYDWWENINISTRSLNFWNFRKKSSIATLVCEDLARNDPAQQVLRSVGPSLVFAILMDGAQLTSRWSGRFARALSSDPGCSVLTLTNLGILRERRDGGRFEPSRKVALWADSKNGVRELALAKDAKALMLHLVGKPCNTNSLDGRSEADGALRWELAGVKDI